LSKYASGSKLPAAALQTNVSEVGIALEFKKTTNSTSVHLGCRIAFVLQVPRMVRATASSSIEARVKWYEKLFTGLIVAEHTNGRQMRLLVQWDCNCNPDGDKVNWGAGFTLPTRFIALLDDVESNRQLAAPVSLSEDRRRGLFERIDDGEVDASAFAKALLAVHFDAWSPFTKPWKSARSQQKLCAICGEQKASAFLNCNHIQYCMLCASKAPEACTVCQVQQHIEGESAQAVHFL
jgi:hypothetical protein